MKLSFTFLIFHFMFFISYAQPGSLDNTFSTDGRVTTLIESGGNYGYSVALQNDGKIVLLGYTSNSTEDFALVRYNTDGTLDSSFNSNGEIITDFQNGDDEGRSVAIQSDGKIIAVGESFNGSDLDFALARYNNDGSVDSTFDVDGKVTTAIGVLDDYAQSIALQSDGKIIVAGSTMINNDYYFATVRYNGDGSLDNTFGSDGKVTTNFGNDAGVGCSVAIQNDGKIVVLGYSINGVTNNFAIVRYTNNGTCDSTFSFDGKLTTSVGGFSDKGYSVAIEGDGKILAAGMSYNGFDDDFALIRYNSDGTLDSTFNSDGKITTAIGSSNDEGSSVALQGDGKIVVAGQSFNGTDFDFSMVRYNTDGGLDITFGDIGKVTTDFGNTGDNSYSTAIQSDGKIVVAGVKWSGSNTEFAIARYNNVLTKIDEADKGGGDLKIEIYPNPSNGKMQLICNQNQFSFEQASKVQIEIFNVLGKKIYAATIKGQLGTVDISAQPKGIYLVEMVVGNEIRSKKIILE